jgi:spermidine/putrescine transport system permease protein
MNVAAPQERWLVWTYRAYVLLFFLYLAAPLAAASVFAFNDSQFPSLPWRGFTLDWFFGDADPKIGMFRDRRIMQSLVNSCYIGVIVSCLSVAVGTATAFLFERRDFPGKSILYVLMITPLVIPGIILGISILVFASTIANGVEDAVGLDLSPLRPGLFLVVLGQFSFLATITTLVIGARLKRFDLTLEDAALNLGASRLRVLLTVTLPYLKPALVASFLLGFLVSFQDFNTTLMLVGSDAPLTITMYNRIAKQGATPVLNAVSFFLILISAALALISVVAQRERRSAPER